MALGPARRIASVPWILWVSFADHATRWLNAHAHVRLFKMVDVSQEKALIFRITHIDNVPQIIERGLYCRNTCPRGSVFREIGNQDLIQRRTQRVPASALLGIACHGESQRHALQEIADAQSSTVRVRVKQEWYF